MLSLERLPFDIREERKDIWQTLLRKRWGFGLSMWKRKNMKDYYDDDHVVKGWYRSTEWCEAPNDP
jgi:hypothetical protein